jgi:hypothetical protein
MQLVFRKLWQKKKVSLSFDHQSVALACNLFLEAIWIDLFKFIYKHKHLCICLREVIKTASYMSISCFQLISISSPE